MKNILKLIIALLIGIVQQSNAQSTSVGAVEIVIFQTVPEISHEDAFEMLKSLDKCVSSFPGFISRELSQDSTGQWLDVVYWTDSKAARHAAKEVMKIPEALEVFSIIDESTMIFKHFNPKHEFKGKSNGSNY